jgi:hypothetical protein
MITVWAAVMFYCGYYVFNTTLVDLRLVNIAGKEWSQRMLTDMLTSYDSCPEGYDDLFNDTRRRSIKRYDRFICGKFNGASFSDKYTMPDKDNF